MSWCSKWVHCGEWPEGVEVTMGRDGNVRRYVPEGESDQLQSENAKLRELVRGLWYCTENENKAMCGGCPLGTVKGDCLALACEKLMYELGMDV